MANATKFPRCYFYETYIFELRTRGDAVVIFGTDFHRNDDNF